jgi:predicted enzyme related to lactoylglutathione lyase
MFGSRIARSGTNAVGRGRLRGLVHDEGVDMPARDSYPDGAPCWADVTSADAAATGAFYRNIFGWDLADMGDEYGHYTMATLDGKMVAAIAPPPPGSADPRSGWNVYLRSGDAAATADAIEKAGGTRVMQPMEVPGQGTMLRAADPTGAYFGVWQPGGHNGAELYAEDGAMAWAEVHSPNGKSADAFYTAAFPLTADPVEGMDYTVFRADGDMVGGRATMPGEPPYWLVYFQVADTDATAARISSHGGTIEMPAEDTPYGRLAVATGPSGDTFAIIKPPPQ